MLRLSEDVPGQSAVSSMEAGKESSNSIFTPELLNMHNYEDWRVQVEIYLLAEDLWDILEPTYEAPKPEDGQAEFKAWQKKNAKALLAIRFSCGPDTVSLIRNTRMATDAWNTLAQKFASPLISEYVTTDDFRAHDPFFSFIKIGDWPNAREYLADFPQALNARSQFCKTALQVAVEGGHEHIVKELVQLMSEEEVEIRGWDGKTALAYVAEVGTIAMARCLAEKNKKLLSIGDARNMTPIVLASDRRNWEMVRYLYTLTPLEDLVEYEERNGASLLCQCIYERIFDIACDLIWRCPRLMLAIDHFGESPLKALASVPSAFLSRTRFTFWQRWIYDHISMQETSSTFVDIIINVSDRQEDDGQGFLKRLRVVQRLLDLSGISRIRKIKTIHAYYLEFLRTTCEVISSSSGEQMQDGLVHEAICQAVDHGFVEFVFLICRAQPELVCRPDEMKRTIFHLAIKSRQEKVFSSLLYGSSRRDAFAKVLPDKFNNNMLHMAAMLSPIQQLNRISGAALQMQRELQWFKEVEAILPIRARESKNYTEHMTPRELFTKTHKELMKEGEKWMKDTANSCTVLGALVITIVFAAAITVPGGNESSGLPIFLKDKIFKIFIIADALSLVSSTTSLLVFWGIVTSRYAEDDFLRFLPSAMTIGLSTLLFSISTMIIAFCSVLLMMFSGDSSTVILLVVPFSIPVALSIRMLIPLFIEIFLSTFGPGIFYKRVGRWLQSPPNAM